MVKGVVYCRERVQTNESQSNFAKQLCDSFAFEQALVGSYVFEP